MVGSVEGPLRPDENLADRVADERVHRLVSEGYTAAAEAYERSRPGYPADLLAQVLSGLGLRPRQRVLDLGAGTGKLARALLGLGLKVVAVEPVAEMRAVMARELPEVEVLSGLAQAIPLPARAVDGVLAGEAFHWFAEAEAVREMERVLTRNGGVALLWHVPVWDEQLHPWAADMRRVLKRRRREQKLPYNAVLSGRWREAFAGSRFGEFELKQAVHHQELRVEDFLDQASSWSFVAALPQGERETTLEELRALVAAHGPRVTLRWRIEAHSARLRACEPGGLA